MQKRNTKSGGGVLVTVSRAAAAVTLAGLDKVINNNADAVTLDEIRAIYQLAQKIGKQLARFKD